MATNVSTRGASPPDDLYDYADNIDELFGELEREINLPSRENDRPTTTNQANEPQSRSRLNGTTSLNVDKEIKVTKKRAPIPKLDEARLLSQAGIPKLRATARKKLLPRFKGKGHEYSDTARLLNFYQLWLDDLYPRAKFADGMAMIEKVGHSKRMVVMRREWIDEGKPKPDYLMDTGTVEDAEKEKAEEHGHGETTTDDMGGIVVNGDKQQEASQGPSVQREPTHSGDLDIPEDDELEALLAEQLSEPAPPIQLAPSEQQQPARSLFGPFPASTTASPSIEPSKEPPKTIQNSIFVNDDDEEDDADPGAPEAMEDDELDALLASQASKDAREEEKSAGDKTAAKENVGKGADMGGIKANGKENEEFNFDEDEEAMAAFDEPW